MAIRTDRAGRRTFGRGDERSRGDQHGVLPAIGDLGLQGTDQVLTANDFEGLKVATHAALTAIARPNQVPGHQVDGVDRPCMFCSVHVHNRGH